MSTALPAVSVEGFRASYAGIGPVNQTVLISEQLLDAKSLLLTANTTTPYTILYLDTKDGPLVLEIPSEVLGRMDDGWFLPPRPSRTQTGPSMDLDRVRRLFIVFLPFF